MLKEIDFTTNSGIKYIMLYDSEKMTDEEALTECEFLGWGMGHKHELFPHYMIIEEAKRPILNTIKFFIMHKYCHDGRSCENCVFYKQYKKPVEDFDGYCDARSCETDDTDYCNYHKTKEESEEEKQ